MEGWNKQDGHSPPPPPAPPPTENHPGPPLHLARPPIHSVGPSEAGGLGAGSGREGFLNRDRQVPSSEVGMSLGEVPKMSLEAGEGGWGVGKGQVTELLLAMMRSLDLILNILGSHWIISVFVLW